MVAVSRRSSRPRFTLFLLVLVSVTVITLDFRGAGSGVIDSAREAALDAMAPVQSAMDTVMEPVSDVWRGATGYGDLEDENVALRQRIDELLSEGVGDENAQRELSALRELVDLDTAGIPTVAAQVVSAPISNFELTVELNRGTSDGVAEGMPVVAGDGLVGRVVQASDNRSVVLLLTDRESSIGVRLAASGDVALADGRGPGEDLELDLVSADTAVEEGEAVVTSGITTSLFPADLPVGRVAEVDVGDNPLDRRVTVEPLVDMQRLQYVKVLQWSPNP